MSTLLEVPAIAELLHCSTDTVKRLCRRGAFEASKPAGRWLATPEAIDEYLKATSNRAQSATRRRRRRAA